VATAAPSAISSNDAPVSRDRQATTRRHRPMPRSTTDSSSRSDSATQSQPVMPASAAPSATNSGMSCARTNSAENSPPSEATRARSLEARTSSPASESAPRTSSKRRPLLGRAMRARAALVVGLRSDSVGLTETSRFEIRRSRDRRASRSRSRGESRTEGLSTGERSARTAARRLAREERATAAMMLMVGGAGDHSQSLPDLTRTRPIRLRGA